MDDLLPVAVLSGFVVIWCNFFEAMGVGAFRRFYSVPPPRADGPPLLVRAFRSHQNQIEQLVLFFPSLWAHAVFVSPRSALVVGSLWFVMRVAYGFAYRTMAKEEPTLTWFTIPCYHLLGVLALGPFGRWVAEQFAGGDFATGVVAVIVAWFTMFFTATISHRSFQPFISEELAAKAKES
jgi:uncharacterized MAPEG superfamily protein